MRGMMRPLKDLLTLFGDTGGTIPMSMLHLVEPEKRKEKEEPKGSSTGSRNSGIWKRRG